MSVKKQYFNFTNYKFSKKKIAYIPETVFVSMNQYGVEECVPVVRLGEIVYEGQVIGRSAGDNALVHSPVPGIVTGFEYLSMPTGKRSLTAIIKMNGNFTYTGKSDASSDWKLLSTTELITLFKNKGIINSFFYKPESLAKQCIDISIVGKVLYVSLFDRQADTFVDSFLTKHYLEKIVIGAQIVAKAIKSSKIVFFYKDGISKKLNLRIKSFLASDIKVEYVYIRDGKNVNIGETSFIEIVNRNFLGQKDLANPAFCIESSSLCDVFNGVVLARPVIDRMVQVTGTGLYTSNLFQVRIGTPIQNLFYECGGSRKKPGKIIINGLVQGIDIADMNTPITKFVKSITLLEKKQLENSTNSSCIHCARCHTVCPVGIHPDRLFEAYTSNIDIPKEIFVTKNWCAECGLCNMVCPARLPLTQAIVLMKEANDVESI